MGKLNETHGVTSCLAHFGRLSSSTDFLNKVGQFGKCVLFTFWRRIRGYDQHKHLCTNNEALLPAAKHRDKTA